MNFQSIKKKSMRFSFLVTAVLLGCVSKEKNLNASKLAVNQVQPKKEASVVPKVKNVVQMSAKTKKIKLKKLLEEDYSPNISKYSEFLDYSSGHPACTNAGEVKVFDEPITDKISKKYDNILLIDKKYLAENKGKAAKIQKGEIYIDESVITKSEGVIERFRLSPSNNYLAIELVNGKAQDWGVYEENEEIPMVNTYGIVIISTLTKKIIAYLDASEECSSPGLSGWLDKDTIIYTKQGCGTYDGTYEYNVRTRIERIHTRCAQTKKKYDFQDQIIN